jgi:hypothetical protein
MTVSAPLSGGWSQPCLTPGDARQLVDSLGPASFDRVEISLQVGHYQGLLLGVERDDADGSAAVKVWSKPRTGSLRIFCCPAICSDVSDRSAALPSRA